MTSRALMDTYGLKPITTVKVFCNKMTYAIARCVRRIPQKGWLHSRWHWYRSPFSLRHQVLWSKPLKAWFYVEDEASIENMLQLPSYEPVSWVAPEPGGVFIDVGAYIGWYAIRAARTVGPHGRVIALEPDASNRRQLERNLSLNKITNHIVIPAAAWSKSGSVSWSPSAVSVWHKINEDYGTHKVETITLDDLALRLSLSRVDWIKIDIEGAEIAAIEGAKQVLETFSPVLFIEIHETLKEVQDSLAAFGYFVERAEFDEPPEKHGWILARRS